jgi:hypothetical protein
MSNVIKLTNPAQIASAELHFQNYTVHPSKRFIYDIPLEDEIGTMFLWYQDAYPSSRIPQDVKEYFKKSVSARRLTSDDPLREIVKDGRKPTMVCKVVEYQPR